MKLNLGPYAKFVTAIVTQAATWASLYWGNGPDARYVSIGIAVAGALGVYAVPNQTTNLSGRPLVLAAAPAEPPPPAGAPPHATF